MANEPNKSNKGTPNTLDDSGFSDIERIGRRASRHTAEDIAQRVRLSEAQRRIQIYERGLEAGPSDEIAEVMSRALSQERKMMNSLLPRITLREATSRQRYTDLTVNTIERAFSESSINGQSSEFSRSSLGQRLSLGMLGQSYEELEGKRARAMNQIGALGQRASSIAEELYDERGKQDPAKLMQLQHLYTQKNRLINRIGSIEAAQRHQRALGLDPESQIESLFNMGQRAERLMFKQGIANELASGSGDLAGKSLDQLKQREAQLAAQLIEELGKLKDSAGKSADEINKMKQAASETADNLKRTEEAISQVAAAGGGGNRYANVGNLLNFAAGAFGVIGAGVQQVAVNQRLGQVANIAGYASIENQKYQMYRAAAGGDVASQLMLSQFGGAESFGRELRAGANIAVGAQIGGGIAQTIAGGVRIASTMNLTENAMATSTAMANRLQGASDILSGGVNTAVSGADLYRDVSGSAAAIQAVQAQMAARRQLAAVSAEQLQGFRDFSVGLGVAAQGMGSRGAGFLGRTINRSNLNAMINARISPEQFAQLSQVGVQEIGSLFDEGQLFGARGLERSGFGNLSENIQRMGVLATAGANNPQAGLGNVLEAAFTKSLEGSKVLNMMVENTGAMVQQSAGRAMGIDTTAAAAQILAAGVNSNDPNQEYALQRAVTAAERIRAIGTDTGVNFAAMSATARISSMTGVSGDEAIILQELDDETLRSMRGMKPNELNSFFRDIGVGVQEGSERDLVEKLIKARLITNLQAGAAGLSQGIDATKLADEIMSGKKLSDMSLTDQLVIGRTGRFAKFAGAKEFMRSATALIAEEPNETIKGEVAGAFKGEGGSEQMRILDDMRTQGFKQLSQAAVEATASFKTAADALKALGVLAKSVENIGDTGGEGRFKTAAADAAGTFGKSVMTFQESVNEFSTAINNAINRSGISRGEVNQFLQDITSMMGQKRGAGP